MADLPLAGKRILVTRARDQSSQFTEELKKLGGTPIEFPTIELLPPRDWGPLDRAVDRLESYHWVIFTSANGVDFFWRRLDEKGKEGLPPFVKVCAIGPATAKRLKGRNVRVDYVPEEYIAEAILKGFEKMAIEGKRILLARASVARDVLPEGLKGMGAAVDVVEAYRTVKPRGGSKRLRELLSQGEVDVITFTSSSTVNHFVDLLKNEDLTERLRGITIACIGPVTSRTAKGQGMEVKIEPAAYTIPALAQAIAEYFAS